MILSPPFLSPIAHTATRTQPLYLSLSKTSTPTRTLPSAADINRGKEARHVSYPSPDARRFTSFTSFSLSLSLFLFLSLFRLLFVSIEETSGDCFSLTLTSPAPLIIQFSLLLSPYLSLSLSPTNAPRALPSPLSLSLSPSPAPSFSHSIATFISLCVTLWRRSVAARSIPQRSSSSVSSCVGVLSGSFFLFLFAPLLFTF